MLLTCFFKGVNPTVYGSPRIYMDGLKTAQAYTGKCYCPASLAIYYISDYWSGVPRHFVNRRGVPGSVHSFESNDQCKSRFTRASFRFRICA